MQRTGIVPSKPATACVVCRLSCIVGSSGPMPTICGRSVIATKNSPASIHAGRTRLSSHVEAGRSPASDSNSVSLFLRVVVDVADVASLLEIGRARVSPDHEYGLVAGVLEPVVIVLRDEDDLSGAELYIGVADASDTAARNQVFELFGVRVTMDVVLRPRREDGDAEDGVLAPTDSRVRSQRTSMSTQPSSARRALSLDVASKLFFIGCSLTRVTSATTHLAQ